MKNLMKKHHAGRWSVIAAGAIIITLLAVVMYFVLRNKGAGAHDSHGLPAHIIPSEFPRRSESLKLSDLVEDFTVVRLDSENPEALLGRYVSPTLSENFIGIKAADPFPGMPYRLYDRASGKFVRKIGNVGRGPGEYSSGLYDWVIDEKNNRVYLVPFAEAAILEYDLSGKYLGKILIPGAMANARRKMKIEVRDGIFTAYTFPQPGDPGVVFTFSKSGEMIATTPSPLPGAESFDYEISVNKTGGTITGYISMTDPTYYHYDHETHTISAATKIDVANIDSAWVPEVYESSRYALVRVYFLPSDSGTKQRDYWLVTDKQSGDRFSGDLVNDFLGGIETINSSHPDKFYRNHYFAFENGYYLETIPAVILKRLLKDALDRNDMTAEVRARVENLYTSFDEDDNHFLFYGKLK